MSVEDLQREVEILKEELLILKKVLMLQSETLNQVADDKSKLSNFLKGFTQQLLTYKKQEQIDDPSV